MNQHAMSLTDILNPRENRWLTDLSRRRELPAGVRIVRFGNDDAAEDADPGSDADKPARRRKRR
jgi:hypothetical protein